ncbi:MAG: undecaprenyl/decaprenyl-phosphate alpha-N-acetylglucosaminyl 1-phosphate transferase [Nitrospira sp.]|nr:undecaprenyl/decaprenyl-phosphate alpha-N-acetylglucosaminyl 1-phosphate transferase [Nitrospira sp.]
MSSQLFFSFLGSLVICMALIPVLRATAGRLQFFDMPGDRKVHQTPMAKVGGLAFAAGTFVAMLLWAPKDPIITSCLIGGAIILLFGAWDDRVGLGYKAKFLGQLVAAAVVVWMGGVHLSTLPFMGETPLPPWIAAPVTLFLLIAVTNALNLADGLDGLAGGMSLLSFGGMAFLAYLTGDWVVMSIMVAVLGGLLGFLRFNTYPARIFMGDAGSQFLGFSLGLCAIVLTDPARGPYSPALLGFIWGLPILDTAGVIVQRLAEGRSPFVADKNHMHHKLLRIGLLHREAVMVIYGLQAVIVSLAFLMRWQSDLEMLAIYACFACAILSVFVTRVDRLLPPRRHTDNVPCPEDGSCAESGWLSTLPIHALACAVTVFLFGSVFLPSHVPVDVGGLAIVLFLLLPIGIWIFPSAASWFIRVGLYVGSTFVLYFGDQVAFATQWSFNTPLNVFFLCLAILIVLTIRFGLRQRFQATPLDYLIVFIAFAIPFLPEIRVEEINIGLLTAKLIVLFFAFELLLDTFSERLKPFGFVSLWVLLGLGFRAWW